MIITSIQAQSFLLVILTSSFILYFYFLTNYLDVGTTELSEENKIRVLLLMFHQEIF